MDSVLGYVEQLSKMGAVAILLLTVAALGWYILKVRDPHEKRLEDAIDKISGALVQIGEISERNSQLFERQSEYLKDMLGSSIKSLQASVELNNKTVQELSHKVDLLIVTRPGVSDLNKPTLS